MNKKSLMVQRSNMQRKSHNEGHQPLTKPNLDTNLWIAFLKVTTVHPLILFSS